MLTIRPEQPEDIADSRRLLEQVFGNDEAALWVDRLRSNPIPWLHLVAREQGQQLGSIVFSRLQLTLEQGRCHGMTMAPLAVASHARGRGIASQLIRVGLERMESMGCDFVMAFGESDYFVRHGFIPAREAGIHADEPAIQHCHVLTLQPNVMERLQGALEPHPIFQR